MQELTFTIETVSNGFQPFKTGVKLLFADNESTQPMPRTKKCLITLREQHPEIIKQIPVHHVSNGFTYCCGLCFTVTNRRQMANLDTTKFPIGTSDQIHLHSFLNKPLNIS